jgi:hypothetical protein
VPDVGDRLVVVCPAQQAGKYLPWQRWYWEVAIKTYDSGVVVPAAA